MSKIILITCILLLNKSNVIVISLTQKRLIEKTRKSGKFDLVHQIQTFSLVTHDVLAECDTDSAVDTAIAVIVLDNGPGVISVDW